MTTIVRRPAPAMPAVHTKPPVLLRYHGGKYKLADWIIGHFPKHDRYTESFGGGGSVLLRKPRARAEIYNDLDLEIVSLFRILRNAAAADRLAELVWLTPFSRVDFLAAYQPGADDMERALHILTRSFLGYSPTAATRTRLCGLGINTDPGKFEPSRWNSVPETVRRLSERMRGLIVENRPAMQVIADHDSADTLHYVDPPYVHAGRGSRSDYRHEMDDPDHVELLEFLKTVNGYVVVSGYHSELYAKHLGAWMQVEMKAYTHEAKPRTEVLWINPHAEAALREQGRLGIRQEDLFASA
ncbi:DNA adenine methylase [Aureimonas glaciei]|nr:DNA adenine methylase [Aureimonas glaciei]